MPATGRLASIVDARRGVARGAWLIARAVAVIAATALAVFHARLLWDRLAAGEMLEPAVVLRWSGALALLVGLGLLRGAGVSLVRDRRSVAVWLLVALLHWNAGPLPAGNSTTGLVMASPVACRSAGKSPTSICGRLPLTAIARSIAFSN